MKNNSIKFGLPPGTVVYTGERHDLETVYERVIYSQQEFLHTTDATDEQVKEQTEINKWVLVKGFKDAAGIEYNMAYFEMPTLILEDVLNVNQRAHISGKDDKICIIVSYYNLDLRKKQVSIWMTPKAVVTFQETHDDLFEPLFCRLDSEHSETRTRGLDRLVAVLLDYVTDLYYSIVDRLDTDITALENHIVNSHDPANHLKEIYQMKTKVQEILQDAKALREVIDSLIDDYDALLSPETLNFAKDINVHVVQIIDNLDSFRSTLSSIVDLSSAVSSNKMNDIMKFLTILSTFFLPLSLMTSWYGMNFEMPEQKTYPREGYFLFILISLCISLGFYLWFRKKKWL